MNNCEQMIINAVKEYLKKRGTNPKYVALSYSYYNDFYNQASSSLFCLGNSGLTNAFYGMPIKFVNRKNYIEAMPRRPRRSKVYNRSCFIESYRGQYFMPLENAVFPTLQPTSS